MTVPMVAWLRRELAHDARYQALRVRIYAAELADDPDWLWIRVGRTKLHVERADFEVRAAWAGLG